MTVAELIEKLRAIPDQSAPVVVEISDGEGDSEPQEVTNVKTREAVRDARGYIWGVRSAHLGPKIIAVEIVV